MSRWLPLVLLMASCSSRSTPQVDPASTQRTARSTFDWKPGLQLDMRIDDRVERLRDGDRIEVRTLKAVVPLTVSALPDGLAIASGDAEIIDMRLDDERIGDVVGAAIGLFDASVPSIRVNETGEFLGLLDEEAEVEALRSGLAQAFSGMEVPPAIKQSMDDLHADVIRRRAEADWYALVEAWIGPWEVGETRSAESASVGGVGPEMTYRVVRTYKGFAPCRSDDPTPDCAVFQIERGPTDEAMQAWLDDLLAREGRREAMTLVEAEIRDTRLIVTHPQTLIPVRVEHTSVTRATLQRADGSQFSPLSKTQERTLTFEPREP